MLKWTFFISIALIFAGCADLKKSEQLERIDAMEQQIADWEKELGEFDSTYWKERIVESNMLMEQLEKLESDTISLDEALQIDRFKDNRLLMLGVAVMHKHCSDGSEKSKKRLKKLKSDIQSGNGRRHKYDEYLKEEEGELERLKATFEMYHERLENIESSMPEAKEKVNSIITERNLTEEVQ